MSKWKHNEKELLKHLHFSFGEKDLSWREDAIINKLNDSESFLYSIDSADQIYHHTDTLKAMKCYGRWAASLISNDILACGTLPRGLALDIGLKNLSEIEFYHFISGVLDVCKSYSMKYEGGNLNTHGAVSGVAWGIAQTDKIIRRSSAKNGDIIFVTCDLGIGWALRLLKEENIMLYQYTDLISSYKDNPIINIDLFQDVWKLDAINCGMDLTDGIIEFGYEIANRNSLGVIFNTNSPFSLFLNDVSSILRIPREVLRFEPGYDTPFAHGWCVSQDKVNQVVSLFNHYNQPYTIMGHVSNKVSGVNLSRGDTFIGLPEFWDDKICNRGNVKKWKEQILKLFRI